jgi:hypothetical protein
MVRAELRETLNGVEKRCTKCGEWKPADTNNFGPLKEGKLGLHPWCRACHREYRRKLDSKRPRIRKSGPQIAVDAPPRRSEPLPVEIAGLISSLPDEIAKQSPFKAYLVTNLITGDRYIGITERHIKDRWRQHIQTARSGRGYLLHVAIQQYGPQNFSCEHVASARSRYLLSKVEQELIEQYDTVEHGYNQTRGGDAGDKVGEPVSVADKTYISFSAAARAHGVKEFIARQRINRYGWTLEQSLGLEPPPRRTPPRSKSYSLLGIRFPSFVAACEFHDLDDSAVRSRLKMGWTKRQAFSIDPPPTRGRNVGTPISVRGIRFKSKAVAALHHGVAPASFYARVRKGWTPEQAAGLDAPPDVPEKEGTHILLGGRVFASIPAFARAYGKSFTVVKSRLILGWSPAQAVDLAPPPPPSGEKNGEPFTLKGVTYSSRAKAAKAHGLDPRKVHKRLKAGWTAEEAFGITPR